MPNQHLYMPDLMANMLQERLSTWSTNIFLYQLHGTRGNTYSLNGSLSSVPLLLRHWICSVPLFYPCTLYHLLLLLPCIHWSSASLPHNMRIRTSHFLTAKGLGDSRISLPTSPSSYINFNSLFRSLPEWRSSKYGVRSIVHDGNWYFFYFPNSPPKKSGSTIALLWYLKSHVVKCIWPCQCWHRPRNIYRLCEIMLNHSEACRYQLLEFALMYGSENGKDFCTTSTRSHFLLSYLLHQSEMAKRPNIYRELQWPRPSWERTCPRHYPITHDGLQPGIRLRTWRAQRSLADTK